MNREELFAAINGIKDEYIAEADPTAAAVIPLSRRLKPFLTMAAAMVIVVGIVGLAGNLDKASSDTAMQEAAMAETVETTSVTAGAAEAYLEEGAAPADEKAIAEEAAPAAAEPAEGAAEDREEAAFESPVEDSVAEKSASQESTEAETGAGAFRLDAEEIFWNGTAYLCDGEVTDLPDGFSKAGNLESEPDAVFYTAYDHDSNAVYMSEEDPGCIYVETEFGFARYLKS